ncbi:MAG: transcriptional repressor LexA [Cyanobacteria bacterium SZAS LIN-2]|nr:transcriptional repressor LexA [Cyanobacteria bacterium SZAS LIN-3]MBS1998549.1 transcriptional repressor LexA [Cyanobacteria bacterium SZAS LIN-2]
MVDTAKPLPARQRDVVTLIVKLTDEHGYPPTLAELATALGLKNRMTVHQHVAALKKKGLVQWEPGLNRSLRVLPEGLRLISHPGATEDDSQANVVAFTRQEAQFAKGKSEKFSERSSHSDDSDSSARPRGIPMVGAIAAGMPIDAIETSDYLSVDTQYANNCFALKVKGESMIEDGIYDGDFVIVKPNPSPLNGEVVVALVDGSATLKRFFKENGGFRLQPANSEMQPIFVGPDDDLSIQGTVVALFRKM